MDASTKADAAAAALALKQDIDLLESEGMTAGEKLAKTLAVSLGLAFVALLLKRVVSKRRSQE